MMKLSIVSTLYQSAPYIQEFYRRVVDASKHLVGNNYEIIFVNDGSLDHSLQLAVSLIEHDSNVIVIDLSRNFGHHKAMMTGLMHTTGDLVFLIDSDLEEEPEWLFQFWKQMHHQNCDVVYGVQKQRKGKIIERWSGILFYRLFNTLSGFQLPDGLVTARLMSRRYVNALIMHQERELFVAGLWHITGFNQLPSFIVKHSTSHSTYTLSRKISYLVNSVTSFSNAPLIGIFYSGLIIVTCSLAYIIYLILHWLLLANPLSGWTSIMASIWLLSGMIILFIGTVGIYVAKIYSESKQRPYTIVRQIYES